MKKVLLLTGSLLAVPVLLLGSYVVLLVAWMIVPTIIPSCFAPTNYHLTRIHWMVEHPKLAWEDDPEQALEHLVQCKPDTRDVALAMLSHSDGTVVSLGMDLVVQASFDDGDALLLQFQSDKRWNHNLALNDEYSAFLLVLWKMKRSIPLTITERKTIEGWSDVYFERVGLTSPTEQKV